MIAKRLLNSVGVGTFLSWILAVPVPAQSIASGGSATGAPATQGAELSEVTVTARRVAENLQIVPISITALSADAIREQNITDPFDFNTTVPGLTVAPTSLDRGSETFTIRGQGQILGGPEPAVASYFNDVPTVVTSQGFFFDLASVEVLKGPQGTLFGINSTGGAVLFVPQRPTNDFEGYVDVTAGNYAERRYQAAINVPVISDVLLVRFAVDADYRDGYTTNPVNGDQYDNINYQAGRLGVTFTPSDWFTNYFLVNFATVNEHGAGNECIAYNPAGAFVNDAGNLAAACAAQRAYGPRQVDMWTPPLGDYAEVRNYAADDTMTFKLADDITLKNIFGFREYLYRQSYDNYGVPFPVFEYSLSRNWSAGLGVAQPSQVTYSDEIQLHGDSFANRFHWQTGLFADTTSPYSDKDIDIATYYSIAQVTFQSLNWKKTHAVYAQGTYDLTDKLNFTVGARYTEDLRRQWTTALNSNGSSDLSAEFHAPTWDLSLQYQVDKDTMLYIASRRGYKSGGFNNVSLQAAQEFQPEHVTDVELGEKTEFDFGGVKGRVNADVFYSQFIGWQERVTAIYPTVNGPLPFAVVTNVADGVVEGAEIEATIIPTPHIEISGFYSYLNPFFTSNTVDGQNFVNSPIAETVKHKASGTVRYLFGLPDSLGDASVSATYSWQSTQTGGLFLGTAPTTDPLHGLLPAYGLLNLRADWKKVLGSTVDIGAFCNNATNKTYLTLMNNAWTLGQDIGEYGPPRMFGLEARWHFGHN